MRASPEIGEAAAGHPFNQEPPSPSGGGFLRNDSTNLTDMPERVKRLPRDHRGFPIPWFVHWQDGEPDFRVIAPRKLRDAFNTPRCWICGERLGVHRVHVIGPMCLVNRVTSEPPSHRDCAEFAAKACPFLTRPRMRRNEKDLPAGRTIAGLHIDRNPGCVCLYETLRVKPFKAGAGTLFRLGEPLRVDWWAEGRQATRAEVLASIDSGYPILLATATRYDGPEGVADLERMRDAAMPLLPAA